MAASLAEHPSSLVIPRRRSPFVFLIIVVLFAVGADRVLGYAAGQLLLTSDFRLSRLYRGDVDADIVVIGNSRAVHMLLPSEVRRTTCRTVFNLALNGMNTRLGRVFVQDFLRFDKKPALAVIEVSNLVVPLTSMRAYAAYGRWSETIRTLLASEQPGFLPWLDISSLASFNGETFLRALAYLGRHDEQDAAPMDGRITPAIIQSTAAHSKPLIVPPANAKELLATIEAFEEKNVAVRLVLAPYHSSFLHQNVDGTDFIERASAALGGRRIVDLSAVLPDDAGFADPLHMNNIGRKRLLSSWMEVIGRKPGCPQVATTADR